MKKWSKLLSVLAALVFFGSSLAACVPGKPTSTVATNAPLAETQAQSASSAAPAETAASASAAQSVTSTAQPGTNPLAVNLTWHMHQPFYYKDENGVYSRPWVRVHATKDYLDMVELIGRYPGMHATINITPSLIEQLDDFTENGAKDLYWIMAEKPAASLTDSDKQFIMQHFFDVNWEHIISRYARYQELLDKRNGTDAAAIAKAIEDYTEEDWRDLQIWFNLAWIDPGYLALPPFKALVDKGSNFAEEDKKVLFDGILELMKKIIPTYKDLQEKGIIELTTTPYAHPILPLLNNVEDALIGNPKAIMPELRSDIMQKDAAEQVARGVQIYKDHFNADPVGMWPGEGSVSEGVLPYFINNGIRYIQTGEPVLVRSLGLEGDRFPRDEQGVILNVDTVYQPYLVESGSESLAVFFRDWDLSDKIGFAYSSMHGKDAAKDLITRLEAIQQKTTQPNRIVTLVIDGENAWENYDMDGKEFLTEFYQSLSSSYTLIPTTPSLYLKSTVGLSTLDKLFPGAWFSANYNTWIGEQEEADSWDLLFETRKYLAEKQAGNDAMAVKDKLDHALTYMLQAEGSDWFWWYGNDQDSGQDAYFDQAYRELLKKVYTSLDDEAPAKLDLPIIPLPVVKPNKSMSAAGKIKVDGATSQGEWKDAAQFHIGDGSLVKDIYYSLKDNMLYLRFDMASALAPQSSLNLYLRTQGIEGAALVDGAPVNLEISAANIDALSHATQLREFTDAATQQPQDAGGTWAQGKDFVLEMSADVSSLPELKKNGKVPFKLVFTDSAAHSLIYPVNATYELQFLSFGPVAKILDVEDPTGDDKGSGAISYPKDSIFIPGVFDLKHFSLGSDGVNLIFSFQMQGPITNGWSSPNGYSVQTFDVYIDKDPGKATGERMLLPGRNAALDPDHGWEFALWAEAWMPKIVEPGEKPGSPLVNEDLSSGIRQYVDTGKNTIVVLVPLASFGEGDPAAWAYAVTVTGQEGYPADDVWRIRDLKSVGDQYKFGGAKGDSNEPRIIDIALPKESTPDQKTVLSSYNASNGPVTNLKPDDFAIIPMLTVK